MGHSCSKQQTPSSMIESGIIAKDGCHHHDEQTLMEFRMSSMSTTVSSGSNQSHHGKMPMRFSYSADFSIFDGNSVSPDSPWGAFLSQGIDDDYSESEDAEIIDAVQQLRSREFNNRSSSDTSRRRPSSLEEEVAKRHSITSLDEYESQDEFAPQKRRRSRRRTSLSSTSGSIANEEEFVPASRRFS
mmetsp:Transcript_2704/g.4091  ORF Transcript_2704/g.4091 Transcript_2704/m.4091 type:complete len:187 (-) Transcript_2704:100-660(-)